jgi:excisionase family DNA binding protein
MKKLRHAYENPRPHSTSCSAEGQISTLTSKLLLSVAEAAAVLGLSSRTVYLLLGSGELTRRKVRRRTVIHRDDVIRFAARAGENQKGSED